MLPDGNGLELLTEWRAAGCKLPIIMLTAWGEPKDISRGYRLGATAYLSKPFEYEAVLTVLDGIFSAAERMPETVTRGGLCLDVLSGQASLNGEDLLLSQKELALLALFVQNEGRSIGADYLYEKVWGQPMGNNDGAVRKQISNLRKKLEGSGYEISHKHGDGYCFAPQNL